VIRGLLRRFGRAAGWIVLAFFISAGRSASAGDFTLNYAIDVGSATDAGKVDSCTYLSFCEIKSADLRMRLMINVHRPDHRSVELRIYGPNGCCYSDDANDIFYLDIKVGLQRLPIYAGRRRQRNEFVLNERLGILYLEFSDIR
jgi:hypothetical protein